MWSECLKCDIGQFHRNTGASGLHYSNKIFSVRYTCHDPVFLLNHGEKKATREKPIISPLRKLENKHNLLQWMHWTVDTTISYSLFTNQLTNFLLTN